MLELILVKSMNATASQEWRHLGFFADDVPNCAPLYEANGFARLPFNLSVPSLEDGKEKELAGEVQLQLETKAPTPQSSS